MRTRISTRYACAEALSVLFPAARRSGPALHRSPYLVPHPQHFHAFSLLTLTWFGILGPFPHHMGSALLLETVLGGMLSPFLNERHECSVDRLTPRRPQDSAWDSLEKRNTSWRTKLSASLEKPGAAHTVGVRQG
jgi:hypothetical protein